MYVCKREGIGTNRFAEAYQVGYERKVLRQDGQSTKTMTYQSRPDVKDWDASPEEKEAFRFRAFEMAWKHVERAPVTEEKGQFGKGIIYRREKG